MKQFAIIFFIIILVPQWAMADIIYFNDGMKTVCQERAWEENQEVKCEYEGTVISYQKKDVLRIQKLKTPQKTEPASDPVKTRPKPPTKATSQPSDSAPADTQQQPPAMTAKQPSETKTSSAGQKPSQKKIIAPGPAEPTGGSKTGGLEFYNPRRPQKYWTSASAKHQTFEQAIAALAKQYDRSPEWITRQMGETNDLDEIHRNLSGGKLDDSAETKVPLEKKPSAMLFYSPRRPNKYWTGGAAKHKTFKQAISALAAQYERSEQWVQQHMGDSNDLREIHENLKNQKLSETKP